MKNTIISLLLVLMTTGTLSAQQGSDDPVSKAYRLRFRTVNEFQPLVQAMLSNRGQITTSDDLNMMVVFDRPIFISQVDSLISYYDRPTQQFLLTFHLVQGTNDPEALEAPDSTLLHNVLDNLFSYDTYAVLDKAYIRVEEKSQTTFDLAEGQFNIQMATDYIRGAAKPVRFRSIVLNEYVRDLSGKITKPIYTGSAEMEENTIHMIAGIKLESTRETVILLVSVSGI
ncbi:hypothetical protein ACFL67_02805 [candidate division KSB1 bacterium]